MPPPKRIEHLWTLRVDGHDISAQLVGQGEHGWECQFLRDGREYASQRFTLYREALALAEAEKETLQLKVGR